MDGSIEWRPVMGYEKLYAVSEAGDVWSYRRGRLLQPSVTARGRFLIGLSQDSKYRKVSVHRLVCEAFHGPAPAGKPNVLHWDDDPSNNHYSNLRWGSQKENMGVDAKRNGYTFPGRQNLTGMCRNEMHPWIPGETTTLNSSGRLTCRECIKLAWRRSRNQQLGEDDPRHGTLTGGRAGCRCTECMPLWKAYRAEKGRETYLRWKAKNGL